MRGEMEDLAGLQAELNRLRELRRERAEWCGPLLPLSRREVLWRKVGVRVRALREGVARRVAPWLEEE